jgi:hypothetical protein
VSTIFNTIKKSQNILQTVNLRETFCSQAMIWGYDIVLLKRAGKTISEMIILMLNMSNHLYDVHTIG